MDIFLEFCWWDRSKIGFSGNLDKGQFKSGIEHQEVQNKANESCDSRWCPGAHEPWIACDFRGFFGIFRLESLFRFMVNRFPNWPRLEQMWLMANCGIRDGKNLVDFFDCWHSNRSSSSNSSWDNEESNNIVNSEGWYCYENKERRMASLEVWRSILEARHGALWLIETFEGLLELLLWMLIPPNLWRTIGMNMNQQDIDS